MFNKTRIYRKGKVLAAKALRYAKTHKMEMFQVGVMAAIVLMPDVGFAQEYDRGTDSAFSTIQGPMDNLAKFMTGKGAKVAATIGACAGIGAWTINTDNQIVKNGMRLTAGTGALLTVPAIVNNIVSGFVIP